MKDPLAIDREQESIESEGHTSMATTALDHAAAFRVKEQSNNISSTEQQQE